MLHTDNELHPSAQVPILLFLLFPLKIDLWAVCTFHLPYNTRDIISTLLGKGDSCIIYMYKGHRLEVAVDSERNTTFSIMHLVIMQLLKHFLQRSVDDELVIGHFGQRWRSDPSMCRPTGQTRPTVWLPTVFSHLAPEEKTNSPPLLRWPAWSHENAHRIRKAHSPDAGHAAGLRAEFASLQLTGNDLSLGLQLPGQTFKLQLLERWDRGRNVVYLLTATFAVISSVISPPHFSLKSATGGLCDGKTGEMLFQFPTLVQNSESWRVVRPRCWRICDICCPTTQNRSTAGCREQSWRIGLSDKQSNRLDSVHLFVTVAETVWVICEVASSTRWRKILLLQSNKILTLRNMWHKSYKAPNG